jgi:hypothetical protein
MPSSRDDGMGEKSDPPLSIPEELVERVSRLCLSLPEAAVRVDQSLVPTRSAAYSFDIRNRSFCLLVAVRRRNGTVIRLLRLRVDPGERQALLAVGEPFFAPRDGGDRIGVVLSEDTDWPEIRELVTESYRILAPKKLSALLE